MLIWIWNSPRGRRQIAFILAAFLLVWFWAFPKTVGAPAVIPTPPLLNNQPVTLDRDLLENRYRIGRAGWINGLHELMLEMAREEFGVPVALTGTTYGEAYIHERVHREGYAIDISIPRILRADMLDRSKSLARRLWSDVDHRVRLVVFLDHPKKWRGKPDHIHIAIRVFDDLAEYLEYDESKSWSLNGQ